MEEFDNCLQSAELDDLRFSGFLYTWCNKRSNGCIFKKLDRVLVNKEWMAKFEHSEAFFLPSSISDHSPSLVKLGLQAIKERRNRSKILSISGEDGSLIEGDTRVKSEAIGHFQNILGFSMPSRHGYRSLRNVIDKHISNDQADYMSREVTNDEIREVCFSLHPNKAPGPDGFNAYFFKKTWHIVGDNVINAIQEFFHSGLLLKELNETTLALVLKVPIPLR
ncbi:hypothetical protein Ddye_008529 [Dipteronia dyeriana]|uniref:RNA-directed DNA polymerase, eukaryota, reverse transcriptase zinc-binding domain protein n=1 Tax=Dipteronia dyeriana TaxID=168575 RepID=A0AAD9X9Z2_9ROSI|nr:hypothetical protein Ddye_008529 [Dipteronia dyeriana]